MNKITLTKSATGYNARYTGPHAAEIRALFGTDTIPTAFGPTADRALVVAEITRLNPDAIVEIY